MIVAGWVGARNGLPCRRGDGAAVGTEGGRGSEDRLSCIFILYLRPSPARFHDISNISSSALMATTFSRLVSKAASIIISPDMPQLFKVVPSRLPPALASALVLRHHDHSPFLRRAHGYPWPRRPRRRPRTRQARNPPLQVLFPLFIRFRFLCIFKQCTISHQQYLFRSAAQAFSFHHRLLP